MSWMHLSLRVIMQLNTGFSPDSIALCLLSLIKRQGSRTEAWFDKLVPKDIALTCQCLAAAGNMLHCFSLFPAESAGRNRSMIHRCPLTRVCPVRIATSILSWCLPNLSRSWALFLHGPLIKSLPYLWPGKSLQALWCWFAYLTTPIPLKRSYTRQDTHDHFIHCTIKFSHNIKTSWLNPYFHLKWLCS
jgi:hypothetical protein